MESLKNKEKSPIIRITTTTWYKDSHSLYDYESTKVTEVKNDYNLNTKWLDIYRKKTGTSTFTKAHKYNL